jgi:hypothetical protein
MAKTVFILGAGASKDCGGPLMKEFLDRARILLAGKQLNDDDKKEFEKVFDALVELRGVFKKSKLDLDNIESIFSAFDMARLIGKLGKYKLSQINKLDHAIKRVIFRTLEAAIKFDNAGGSFLDPSASYQCFASLLHEMENGNQTWSVLTFNYDYALDYALYRKGLVFNYYLDETEQQQKRPYLKLHGSLGWGYCEKCKTVKHVMLQVLKVDVPENAPSEIMYNITEDLNKLQHKREYCPGKFEPLIVPPTWNKGQHYGQIRKVWQQAAIELGEAENIIVMGYSLPDTDLFFRYLFALGAVGDAHIRRFWVFNPDKNTQVKKRFRDLIGKGIEDRFRYYPMTFSEGLEHLEIKGGGFIE